MNNSKINDLNIKYLELIASISPMHPKKGLAIDVAKEGVNLGCDNPVLIDISNKSFTAYQRGCLVAGQRKLTTHRMQAYNELKRLSS